MRNTVAALAPTAISPKGKESREVESLASPKCNMHTANYTDLKAVWVDVDDCHEMMTNDGGIFAVVEPKNDGTFFWSLASLSFSMPNGIGYGTCAQARHARRTVERIRRAYVSARS